MLLAGGRDLRLRHSDVRSQSAVQKVMGWTKGELVVYKESRVIEVRRSRAKLLRHNLKSSAGEGALGKRSDEEAKFAGIAAVSYACRSRSLRLGLVNPRGSVAATTEVWRVDPPQRYARACQLLESAQHSREGATLLVSCVAAATSNPQEGAASKQQLEEGAVQRTDAQPAPSSGTPGLQTRRDTHAQPILRDNGGGLDCSSTPRSAIIFHPAAPIDTTSSSISGVPAQPPPPS